MGKKTHKSWKTSHLHAVLTDPENTPNSVSPVLADVRHGWFGIVPLVSGIHMAALPHVIILIEDVHIIYDTSTSTLQEESTNGLLEVIRGVIKPPDLEGPGT